MKKLLLSLLPVLLFPMAGYGQFTHLGLAAAYATNVKEPGFGAYGIFRVNDEIKLTPNAFYYLPHTINTAEGINKFSWWMINLDGNYVILNKGIFEGYGIMGLNFTSVTGERDEEELGQRYTDKRTISKIGLNMGAGMRFNLGDKVSPFAELRYTLGSKVSFPDYTTGEVSLSQFGIHAGLLYRITEDKDRTAEEY